MAGALIVLRIGAAAIWPTINDVQTGATLEYPELRPQRSSRPFDEVYAAALAAARDMGWQIVVESAKEGEISAVATTRLMRFKDDVTITVSRDGIVNIRSRSRIGKGDFGANARRIREFQARLAPRL